MKVPMQLRRRPTAEAATGLLLLDDSVGELLNLCARLGVDPLPRLFAVASGFLLELSSPISGTIPGAIRLRRLGSRLFLPVDADLWPRLHSDEIDGLTRQRGLVFLPGGRVLAFGPEPLRIGELLQAGPVRQADWQPLPAPPALAERIRSIELDMPQASPEAIVEEGGSDIGTEEPRPSAGGGVLDKLAGKASLGMGRALVGLGNSLGWQGLARLGAQWIQNAVQRVPRLSERILGQQEAALRELLRLFQIGDLDNALRRALPIGGDMGRGGTVATGATLPLQSLFYSLANLLGGRGPASVWFGGGDVQRDLAAEYRKAAERAEQQGDHRRAAFIWARLLNDYRRAADVLLRGGLAHDAAIIYLKRLHDPRAAARAFEAAGEIDRALELYRQEGEHLAAGDLLRRIGEDEEALAEYQQAAEQLVVRNQYLQAGELMADRAHRPDLAPVYWRRGWDRRPSGGDAVACGLRLADDFADRAATRELLDLAAQGRACFDQLGADPAAAQFYNSLATLTDRPGLSSIRADLRDLVLIGLAVKLRQRVASRVSAGTVASDWLGQSAVWPAPLVSDAQFAVKTEVKQPRRQVRPAAPTQVRIGSGLVTAACAAPLTGAVVVGFDSGEVHVFHPRENVVRRLPLGPGPGPVCSLAVSSDGEIVSVLQKGSPFSEGETWTVLTSFCARPPGEFDRLEAMNWDGEFIPWLAPLLVRDGSQWLLARWHESHLAICSVPAGSRRDLPTLPTDAKYVIAALLLPALDPRLGSPALLLFDGDATWCLDTLQPQAKPHRVFLGWGPAYAGGGLHPSPLSWLQYSRELELAALDDETPYWSRLHFHDGRLEFVASSSQGPHRYRTAAVVRPGLVAGVTDNRIDWLRAGQPTFTRQSSTPVSLDRPVACFASQATNELLVVCANGTIERVHLPG